jgi:DNA-3-methyladenine glycosylase II
LAKHPLKSVQLDKATLAKALRSLARQHRALATAIKYAGPLPDRSLPKGFATIAKIIVEQQLSLASAEAIWRRLVVDLGEVNSVTVLTRDVPHLKGLGLGARKAEYIQGFAQAIHAGDLDLPGLQQLPDDQAIARLTAVRGIGPWTAEVYMLFAEGRSDVFPAGDIALQAAAQRVFDLNARPDIKTFRTMAENWRPWRGAAARLLWQVYRCMQEEKKGT